MSLQILSFHISTPNTAYTMKNNTVIMMILIICERYIYNTRVIVENLANSSNLNVLANITVLTMNMNSLLHVIN